MSSDQLTSSSRPRPALFRALRKMGLLGLLALGLVAAQAAGLFDALDNRLSELRFAAHSRSPSGSIVLVDIDARSLSDVGVWPWPRHLYGELLASAATAKAARVAFDIDFSSSSTATEDQAFADALATSGIETYLAAFAQPETAGAATLHAAMPIEPLLQASWPVGVDVGIDPDGRLRHVPFATDIAGETLSSLASVLAGRENQTGTFGIDYSIDASQIPRISFVDLLHRRVAPEALAGKTLIVGASAAELRDLFSVPVFGTVSGSLVHALAAETLIQKREISERPVPIAALGLIGILALAALARVPARRTVIVLTATMVSLECGAFLLQQYGNVSLQTASLHGLGLGLLILTLLREFNLGRLRVWLARLHASNSEGMLEHVVDESFDGIVIVDGDGRIARSNAEAATLLCSPVPIALFEHLPLALSEALVEAARLGATKAAHADRTLRYLTLDTKADERVIEYSIAPFWMRGVTAHEDAAAEDVLHLCLTLRDVTDRERAQQRLRHQALHDMLTGLANRRALEGAISDLGSVERPDGVALMAFDLDRFKAVNDALGHGTGDAVLVETARRARRVAGPDALVARIGGDEFAILLRCDDVATAVEAAQRLLAAIREPYFIRGHRISVGSSVGIGWWQHHAVDGTDMMRQVDIALCRAKSLVCERIAVFDSGMEVDRLARLALERDIENALDKGEFEVVYQPQVLIENAEIIGAEALVRWRHPVRGYVSPIAFIPVAEEMGYIHRLGAFVLETACLAATGWPDSVKVAVNVSPLQFEAGDLVAAVERALALSGLPARRLELEITESAFVSESSGLQEAFAALTALGISFALDDYGTGYSSLGYLRRFPISKIKIDRSFVTDAPESPPSIAVLKSVITLGEGLDIRVIAEGIETLEQAEVLQAIGCREGQGYLYSKPISRTAFEVLINGMPNPATTPIADAKEMNG